MALTPCLRCGILTNHGSYCQRHVPPRTRGRKLQAMRQAFVVGRPCAICGRPAEHLDHVTPLIRGGTDHPTNLQPLCADCNLRKSDH